MIAAADIGGHTLTVGTAENGAVLRKRTVATPPERTPRAVCAAARAILDGLGVPAETPLALGVPGFVLDGERVSGCPNLSGWEGVTAGASKPRNRNGVPQPGWIVGCRAGG